LDSQVCPVDESPIRRVFSPVAASLRKKEAVFCCPGRENPVEKSLFHIVNLGNFALKIRKNPLQFFRRVL